MERVWGSEGEEPVVISSSLSRIDTVNGSVVL